MELSVLIMLAFADWRGKGLDGGRTEFYRNGGHGGMRLKFHPFWTRYSVKTWFF
jgi:hypothetical protein